MDLDGSVFHFVLVMTLKWNIWLVRDIQQGLSLPCPVWGLSRNICFFTVGKEEFVLKLSSLETLGPQLPFSLKIHCPCYWGLMGPIGWCHFGNPWLEPSYRKALTFLPVSMWNSSIPLVDTA